MWILIGCTLFWLGVGVILYKRRERKIRKLILYLSHIQDRISLPPFESYSEGQLGILQSEIYKVMNLLEEQSRQSKEQNTYLADMLSDISHQLKTPLAGITLLTDLLKNPDLPEQKRIEYVVKIAQQTEKNHLAGKEPADDGTARCRGVEIKAAESLCPDSLSERKYHIRDYGRAERSLAETGYSGRYRTNL